MPDSHASSRMLIPGGPLTSLPLSVIVIGCNLESSTVNFFKYGEPISTLPRLVSPKKYLHGDRLLKVLSSIYRSDTSYELGTSSFLGNKSTGSYLLGHNDILLIIVLR